MLVFGVCLAALAVSLAAGALLARSLTRPIQALISGARAIGEGDLSYRIDYDRTDEFSDLAEQFNITAARLEAQRQQLLEVQAGLENEVARRTSQLEDANGRLQRLDQMRMLFLADIGHELRTPLTVLRGEAEVALARREAGRRAPRDAAPHRRADPADGPAGRGPAVPLARRGRRDPLRDGSRSALQDVLDVALDEARVLAAGERTSCCTPSSRATPAWSRATPSG